jgi:hypothetical protein
MYNESKEILSSTYYSKNFHNPTLESTTGLPLAGPVFFFFSLNQCNFPYCANPELSTIIELLYTLGE